MANPGPQPAEVPDEFTFHHAGFASPSLARDGQFFQMLGYIQEGPDFSDPGQGIAGRFLIGPGPRLELLENLPGSDTLSPWLGAGGRIYHFAYLVPELESAMTWARENRGKMIVPPRPAVAFDGRHICFFAFREGMVLEFVEAGSNG